MQVDYIALARLIGLIQATKAPNTHFILRPQLVTWIFFALETASLACQGAGRGRCQPMPATCLVASTVITVQSMVAHDYLQECQGLLLVCGAE